VKSSAFISDSDVSDDGIVEKPSAEDEQEMEEEEEEEDRWLLCNSTYMDNLMEIVVVITYCICL